MTEPASPMISVEILYRTGREDPAGVDLGDSYEMLQLQQRYDKALIEDDEGERPTVDWEGIEETALELLQRSVDMRLLILLAAAVLRTRGLEAFVDVLRTIDELVREHWEAWHPFSLDEGDGIDAEWRANVIAQLGDRRIHAGLRELRPFPQTRLASSALASLLPDADGMPPNLEPLRQAMSEQAPLQRIVPKVRQVLVDGGALLERIVATLAEQRSVYVDLARLTRVCLDASRCLAGIEPGPADQAANDVTHAGAEAGGAEVGAMTLQSIDLPQSVALSRDRAKAVLQQLIDFFEQAEPASPVPLYLRRAQSLIGLDFRRTMKLMGGDMQSFMNEE